MPSSVYICICPTPGNASEQYEWTVSARLFSFDQVLITSEIQPPVATAIDFTKILLSLSLMLKCMCQRSANCIE